MEREINQEVKMNPTEQLKEKDKAIKFNVENS